MIGPDPTHQPTHPPTHSPNYAPTHGWGSLHRFQIFKQNWNILISSSVIEFWLILGVPSEGGGGWKGVEVVREWSPHTCTCTCMYTHAHAYDIIGNPQDFPKSNGGGHLHEIIMFTMHVWVCVCMHACMCVCTCVWDTLQLPLTPSTHPPSPRAAGSRKHQNSISLELIKIIRFCLKILYLWTFLNSYRL